MGWLKGRRGFLIAPLMVAMCGDSFAGGGCGKPEPAPETGSFPCSMEIAGSPVPCTGEWSYSKERHEFSLSLIGRSATTGVPRGKVSARLSSEAAPVDARLDDGVVWSTSAVTDAGEYQAGGRTGPGATGTMHLDTLRPPKGTFSTVMVPLMTYGGDVLAPAGTTVRLEASF